MPSRGVQWGVTLPISFCLRRQSSSTDCWHSEIIDPGLITLQAEEKPGDGKRVQGYKGEKEAKQRRQAGNRAAWNTLFMRADTVAEAIAAHLGMPKAQLLDREAADLPVRMALGEAHVINLTKQSLGMLLLAMTSWGRRT